MKKFEMVFRFNTPSRNVMDREHYRKKNDRKNRIKRAVVGKFLDHGIRYLGWHCEVHYVRIGKRFLDEDNLAGSAKPFLDALCRARIITDDNPKYVSFSCSQEKGLPGTRITILPIEQV